MRLLIFSIGNSEEAVEYDELNKFLRLDEGHNDEEDEASVLKPSQPVGVPGASSPQQMTNQKPSFAAVPSPHRDTVKHVKSGKARDAGEELDDARLQGVKVSDAEITELLRDLGLNEADADELASGLGVKGAKGEEGSGSRSGEKDQQDSNDERVNETKVDEVLSASAEKVRSKP